MKTVFAIHNFDAENDDEITLRAGEPVVVMERDDGFNDGWWQGRNVNGQVGLFPACYTTAQYEQDPRLADEPMARVRSAPIALPTPSTLSTFSTGRSPLPCLAHSTSDSSLDSIVVPCHRKTFKVTPSRTMLMSRHVQKTVAASLNHPNLADTAPEDWDVDQVAVWLSLMGFDSVADLFQEQEISGDVLLEISFDSLKNELLVDTYGKRFRIYHAISALRDQVFLCRQYQSPHSTWASDNPSTFGRAQYGKRRRGYSAIGPSMMGHGDSAQSRSDARTSASESTSVSQETGEKSSLPKILSRKELIMHSTSRQFSNPPGQVPRASPSPSAFLPGTKPQTVLQVATEYSLDSMVHRHCWSDESNVAPDMEGWLFKQGDRYKRWNRRWFVLKGPNLFYFKNAKDVRMKGIINLRGYRFVTDETIQPGSYSFMVSHERERTFYFYTDSERDMKKWVQALIKATITRDFGAPVLSSSNIPTVTLDMARRMNPRPPSIMYRREIKKHIHSLVPIADSREETMHQLSNALRSMSYESYKPSENESVILPSPCLTGVSDSGFDDANDPDDDDIRLDSQFDDGLARDNIAWIHSVTGQVLQDLRDIRSGQTLAQLLQALSGQQIIVNNMDPIASSLHFMNESNMFETKVTLDILENDTSILDMLDRIRHHAYSRDNLLPHA